MFDVGNVTMNNIMEKWNLEWVNIFQFMSL